VTPIEHIRPTQPGNWTRRPDSRRKKRDPDAGRNRPAKENGRREERPERRDHIVDEKV
jgi:hypothetical protein